MSDIVENFPETHFDRSREYDRQGHRDLSIEAARKAVELAPHSAQYHHFLGKLLAKAGQFDEAETAQRDAIALDCDSAPFHKELSQVLMRRKKLDEAIIAAQTAVSKGAGDAENSHHLGNLLGKAGRLEEAEAAQRRAAEINGNVAPYFRALSRVLNRQDKLDGAIIAAQAAVGKDANEAEYCNHLASLLGRVGRLKEAEAACLRAIEINSDYALAFRTLSRVLNRQGKLDEAIIAAQAAVSKDASEADYCNHQASLLGRAGRLQEAEAAYRQAIEINATCADYHKAISKILYRLGRYDEAIEACRTAIQNRPQQASDYHDLAELLANAAHFTDADTVRREAMEHDCSLLAVPKSGGQLSTRLAGRCRQIDRTALDETALTALVSSLALCSAQWWSGDLECLFKKQAKIGDEQVQWPFGQGLGERTNVPIAAPPNLADPPLLSVMMPVYNLKDDNWLHECIESVLLQDRGAERAEIVIVDDASPNDRAKQIAAGFGPRVTYMRNHQNMGIVGNHNNCLRHASGKFVHILHQDDEIEPDFYDALLGPMAKDDEIVAGFTNVRIVGTDGERMSEQPLNRTTPGILENWFPKLALGQRILFPSIIVRRSAYQVLGGFTPSLFFAFDWEMWGRLAASGKFWYEPRALARYRKHDASVTNSLSACDRILDEFRTVAYLLPLLPAHLRPTIGQVAFNRLLRKDWNHVVKAIAEGDDTAELQQLIQFLLYSWASPDERDDIRHALDCLKPC